jgi:hypothetical protein
VLRRIFGTKRNKVTREWRRLHDGELYAIYPSLNVIWVMKSRRMRRTERVARMEGGGELHTGFRWENLRVGDFLEDPGINGRIILKWIFQKWDGAWTGLMWLRIGAGGGLL